MTVMAANDDGLSRMHAGQSSARGESSPVPVAVAEVALARGERYVFVDALRGIAAALVLLRHLFTSTPLYFTLQRTLPHPLQSLCYDGLWGVHIFFVLSGFVIAHSLRNIVISPKSVGRFILRRQLRLDPLYWFIILLTLCLLGARHTAAKSGGVADWGMPTAGTVLANLFYLHNILHSTLGTTQIVSVSWTLCIEVQFYLFFIFCLSAGQFVARRVSGKQPATTLPVVAVVLVVGMAVASLTVLNRSIHQPEPADWSPWFTGYWYYFATGATACWAIQGRIKPVVFVVLAALVLGLGVYWRSGGMLTGGAAASILFAVGMAGQLGRWLNIRPLQYLGKVSYSLYMVHLFVVFLVMNGGFKVTHENRPAAVGWLLLAAALSLVAAHLTYVFIEKPSLRFSERFKERRAKPSSNVAGLNEQPSIATSPTGSGVGILEGTA